MTAMKGRLTQVAVKYGETASTATVCCNACRTCVQTNLLTAALAGIAATATFILRRLPRFADRS